MQEQPEIFSGKSIVSVWIEGQNFEKKMHFYIYLD